MNTKHHFTSLPIRRLQLPKNVDSRGILTIAESETHIPFPIERVFWITSVPAGQRRGGHAHWHCHEALFAVAGRFTVDIDDGNGVQTFVITCNGEGVVVPAGAWCVLHDFSDDAVCLVMASEPYDATGYCHDHSHWQQIIREMPSPTPYN